MSQTYCLYEAPTKFDSESHSNTGNIKRSDPLPIEVTTKHGTFHLDHRTLTSGPSAGVELLTITGTRVSVTVVPTRGMGIWRAKSGSVDFGWNSPVRGPVHPRFVPLNEPSGLGWLSGFDELLVRCGLESNGAPDFDDKDRLRHPLHGRIANTPAESLSVTIDEDAGTIEVIGVVREARLFFTNWTLTSIIRMHVNEDVVEIEDRVTNWADADREHQLLYHINVGSPVLEKGAKLIVPATEVVPKTPRAVEGLASYEVYGGPEVGFAEQVYLMKTQADSEGWSQALLRSVNGDKGLGVRFNTDNLPYFVQWKNTAGENDGYVTGLEPSTNFPNTRSFEESKGRVVKVASQSTIEYRLQLFLLAGAERVQQFEDETISLQRSEPKIHPEPLSDWCQ